MKNKLYLYFAAVVIGVYAIINILLFTLVDFARLNHIQFWISWAFMFGFNSLMAIVIGLKTRKKYSHDIRIYPVSIILGGNAVYFVLGIIFTLVLPATLWVVLTDVIVAIVYILIAMRFVFMVTYIRGNDAARKKKIAYIRQMTAMVESYVSLAPDADTADAVKKLSADFRYSDPMSHESLASNEQKLLDMVVSLEFVIQSGDKDHIASSINDIKRELKLRNAMCANLK